MNRYSEQETYARLEKIETIIKELQNPTDYKIGQRVKTKDKTIGIIISKVFHGGVINDWTFNVLYKGQTKYYSSSEIFKLK